MSTPDTSNNTVSNSTGTERDFANDTRTLAAEAVPHRRSVGGSAGATRPSSVVIVGAGAAGHSAATNLRREGYDGPLRVVHNEATRPYNRTLVNKAVLPGLLSAGQASLPPLDALDAEMLTGNATRLDADARELVLDNGERLPYDSLIIATGSNPRPLDITDLGAGREAGARTERVVHLHTVEDAVRIRTLLDTLGASARVALLGAGFIGAETASYLSDLDVDVHLVSRTLLPLATAVGDAIAARVSELHQAHINTHFGRDVTSLESRVTRGPVVVRLDDGTALESDLVLVAHGTTPAIGWLAGSTGGRLVVDDRLRVPGLAGVYAAGSVATHTSTTGELYRVDHWDDAVAQGAHAARALLHDAGDATDPGTYAPATGFTLNLYRTPIATLGVPGPDAEQRQHHVAHDHGMLTTFHDPRAGAMTAAAGLHAGREVLALRDQLHHP